MPHTNGRGWWWQQQRLSLCRYYALIAAVVLIFFGIVAFEDNSGWLAWWAIASRLALASVFAYAGLLVRYEEDIPHIVQGMGWLLVVIGGAAFLNLWPLDDVSSWSPVGPRNFTLGVTSILAGRYLRDPSPNQEEDQPNQKEEEQVS